MARKKRWVVREPKHLDGTAWYGLCVGPKPRKPENGWNANMTEAVAFLCSSHFEQFVPKRYHLEPDGGPVEIFADEE